MYIYMLSILHWCHYIRQGSNNWKQIICIHVPYFNFFIFEYFFARLKWQDDNDSNKLEYIFQIYFSQNKKKKSFIFVLRGINKDEPSLSMTYPKDELFLVSLLCGFDDRRLSFQASMFSFIKKKWLVCFQGHFAIFYFKRHLKCNNTLK